MNDQSAKRRRVLDLLAESWEQVEALAGIAAAFFIGYIPPVILFFVTFATLGQRQWGWSLLAGAGLVFTLVLAVWVTRLTGESLYERYPQFRPARHTKKMPPGREVNSTERSSLAFATSHEDVLQEKIEELNFQISSIDETLDSFTASRVRPVALLVVDRLTRVSILLRPFLTLWWLAHFAAGAIIGLFASRMVIDVLNNPAWAFLVVLPVAFQVAFLFAVNLYLVMAIAVLCQDRRLPEFVWRWRLSVDLLLSLGVTIWSS